MYHFGVAEGLKRNTDNLELELDKINHQEYDIVILSSEAFGGLEISELERLRNAIGKYPIEIVYYARRWSERITSDWRERIRMGRFITFPELYIRILNDPFGTGEMNYSRVWDRFARIFGRQSLRIVPFSNLVDAGVDPFDHFCRVILGLAETPQTPRGLIQRNKSADMFDTEILRTLNYLHFLDTAQIDIAMRVKLSQLRKKKDPKVIAICQALTKTLSADTQILKVDDNATTLATTWMAMASYADCLVSPEYGKAIFERRALEFDVVGQNYLLRSDVVDTLREMFTLTSRRPLLDILFLTLSDDRLQMPVRGDAGHLRFVGGGCVRAGQN